MGDREVWAYESDDEPICAAVYLDHLPDATEWEHKPTTVRYVPEPARVEGWPEQDGWYWVLDCGGDWRPGNVRGSGVSFCGVPGPRPYKFFGPLAPPKVEG